VNTHVVSYNILKEIKFFLWICAWVLYVTQISRNIILSFFRQREWRHYSKNKY